MNSFLFLAQGPTLNPEVHNDTRLLKVCINQKANVFQSSNPELWELLKNQKVGEGTVLTNFDCFSLAITDNLDLRTGTAWGQFKPMLFDTLFIDTKDKLTVWKIEEHWKQVRSNRKNRNLMGFPINPTFRHWL